MHGEHVSISVSQHFSKNKKLTSWLHRLTMTVLSSVKVSIA